MALKSPTPVRAREVIGVDQFTKRKEVFGKHDTIFLPLPSPTRMFSTPDCDPIVTSNHGKTTSNFKRNGPGYSSMRETRTEEMSFELRPRKYSDNFTSELNQSDDVDYRRSMTERTRRLSKLRRDFLTSNLHEPTNESPFNRTGNRASMPVRSASVSHYKVQSSNIYKFPFAEPYASPSTIRRVVLDLGPSVTSKDNENQVPEVTTKHQSLPDNEPAIKVDHQKLFEELVQRYSPQRKPIDWSIPPSKPRIVGSVRKSISSTDSTNNKISLENLDKNSDDNVFDCEKSLNEVKKSKDETDMQPQTNHREDKVNQAIVDSNPNENEIKIDTNVTPRMDESNTEEDKNNSQSLNNNEHNSKISLTELAEKTDYVPELPVVQREISKDTPRKSIPESITDLSIPALVKKIKAEGDDLENQSKESKKVKRKRSFLDKLLGRKKEK